MNTYFKVKLATVYIIPFCILALNVMVVLVCGIKESIRKSRIKKFFESNGYERKLLGVASFGYGEFYGWIRQPDESKQITGQCVDDRDLRGLSLKTIKEIYK